MGRTIEEVLETHTPAWMTLDGVVGTGIAMCDGEPCIRVLLSGSAPASDLAIPARVEGYPVELVISGRVTPRQ